MMEQPVQEPVRCPASRLADVAGVRSSRATTATRGSPTSRSCGGSNSTDCMAGTSTAVGCDPHLVLNERRIAFGSGRTSRHVHSAEGAIVIHTLAIWTVRQGSEDEFVRAWEAMGEETKQRFLSASGTLLRDRGQPNRFISFGPWESAEQVVAWRESAAFRNGVANMSELLDDFEPSTMELVMRID